MHERFHNKQTLWDLAIERRFFCRLSHLAGIPLAARLCQLSLQLAELNTRTHHAPVSISQGLMGLGGMRTDSMTMDQQAYSSKHKQASVRR